MTTFYTAELHCDRCGHWVRDGLSQKPSGLAKAIVEKAKRIGWSRSTKSIYTDLCPHCLEQSRKDGTA